MPEVHIPLVHGTNEAVDPKLLPNGWLTKAENVRFRKDGRLGSRYGYKSASSSSVIAAGDFGYKRSIYIKGSRSISTPPSIVDHRDGDTFSDLGNFAQVPDVGAMRRSVAGRNYTYTATATDVCACNGYLVAVYCDYDPVGLTSNGIFFSIIDPASGALVYTSKIGVSSTSDRNCKVVACGTTACVLLTTTLDGIQLTTIDTTNTNFPQTHTSPMVVAASGRAPFFDVAPLDSSNFLLVYESAATTLRIGSASTAGVFTQIATQATSNPSRPSIALGGTSGNVAVCWAEGATFQTGNLNYRVDTTGGSSVVAKTTIDSSGNVTGFPVAGGVLTDDYAFAWSRSTHQMGMFTKNASASYAAFLAACSKPFSPSSTQIFLWAVNYADSSLTSGLATYKLIDMRASMSNLIGGNYGTMIQAVACQHSAQPGAYLMGSSNLYEPRRFAVSTAALSTGPGSTGWAIHVPIVSSKGYQSDIVRFEFGNYLDRLLSAKLNGQLFFSGGRLLEFDGSRIYETALGDGPEYVTVAATAVGSGNIPAGSYQYCVTYAWFDSAGRRHESPPSTPVAFAPTSLSNAIVTLSVPTGTLRSTQFVGAGVPFANVYRTQAGGTVFYLVNSSSNIAFGVFGTTTVTYTDSSTDATIATNAVLYTQGARGGLSGLLPNDEPPPCKFVWAGNNRLILGGLEDPSAVQWSKLVFPGEPVQFSIDSSFKGRVDGEVTAVACLDGVWFVFTASSIWAFSGDGPDDTGAGGTFGDPRKLPTDIGCISQRSIVEVPQGLLFQGRNDRIYLLPRGGNAPQWVGQAVRDTLSSYPFIVRAVMVPDSNVAAFACIDSGATDGRILIYDTRINEWTVDNPFNGAINLNRVWRALNVWGGKIYASHANSNICAETSLYSDDESSFSNRAIVMTLTTGDIRPFGVQGHGRTRRAVVTSEYRSATTFTVEDSLDGGQSYATAASFTPSNSAGDTVKVSYDIPVVKGEAYRFRIISTPTSQGEGFVFNAITLEVFQERGTPRLGDAYRV